MFNFDETSATPLCEIMLRNRSDKGLGWHNYTTFYYSIMKDRQFEPLRIFELGLGTNNVNLPSNMGAHGRPGASLYGWKEFFPNSKIYGADIDRNILFTTNDIHTFYCDQTNESNIKSMWSEEPELSENFDFIIEDGLHEFHANVCFFENSIHKLKKNGFYIIEDIKENNVNLFLPKIEEWKVQYPHLQFHLLTIPHSFNHIDNRLLVVSYF